MSPGAKLRELQFKMAYHNIISWWEWERWMSKVSGRELLDRCNTSAQRHILLLVCMYGTYDFGVVTAGLLGPKALTTLRLAKRVKRVRSGAIVTVEKYNYTESVVEAAVVVKEIKLPIDRSPRNKKREFVIPSLQEGNRVDRIHS